MSNSRELKLNPHFERVPGSDRHAFLRCEPDKILALTPRTFELLRAFSSPRRVEEVLPEASAQANEVRKVLGELGELGVLLHGDDDPAPYAWHPAADPLFGVPGWPRVSRGDHQPIVALGARYDDATLSTYPRGSSAGPLALRRAAHSMRLHSDETGRVRGFPRVEEPGVRVLEGAALADGGDIVPEPACSWAAFARGLEERLEHLGAKAKVLLMGGDHSVTLPALRALATRHRRMGVLHFDAHGDFGPDRQAHTVNHANVMRHVSALEQVEQLVQVGVRGFQSLPAQRGGYRYFTPRAMRGEIEAIVESLDPELAWYVSLDIDVLDPAVAPATAAPEPGGASFAELCETLTRCVAGRRIIGADLVEVRDVPGERLTGRVGAHLLVELAAALAQPS